MEMDKQIIKSNVNKLLSIFSEEKKIHSEYAKWLDLESECRKKLGLNRCIDGCKFRGKCSVNANVIKYTDLITSKEDEAIPTIMELYPHFKLVKKNGYIKCLNKGMKYLNEYSNSIRAKNNNSACVSDNCISCKSKSECVAYKTYFPDSMIRFLLYNKMQYFIYEYPEVVENI